jgi:group II intron reverse transcriptase/maturase
MESLLGHAPKAGTSMSVLTKQQRIAELARRSPQMGFTSLAYLMDIDWLREAFLRTRKDGAPGVDGQTWAEYANHLEANLQSLLDRAKSGTYRAPPVRRVHIPKAGSTTETRPIGIPTVEDKILQRAVVMLLEPIYEQDFDAGSYGFRPGRSAHDALEDLWKRTMDNAGGWILEVDIRKFFDTLDHAHLREFLKLRVRDGVLRRLIGKWLKAGVLEAGSISYPESGSPQGGVISPLLANVFLHYVLDAWFRLEVQPRLRGRAHLIRYADDFVILFRYEDDARRVLEVLPKRFGKFGLTLHPDKTRLVSFRRPPAIGPDTKSGPEGRPGTFDLLGFTHYWGQTRKGGWAVKRKTASKRLSRAVRSIAEWCRQQRHRPIREQHAVLSQKVRGHYAYYGITGNARALAWYLCAVHRAWRRWLDRRNRRREMTWARFNRLLERYPLPPPRIVHSYVT